MRYMIIKKSEYERLKRTSSQTVDNYTYLLNNTDNKIKNMADAIHNLGNDIKTALEKLNLVESARRKNASRIGGLTTSLNKEKNKTKELLNAIDSQKEHYENKVSELQDNVKDLEVKLEESMSDKYVVKKLPADKGPRKRQTMKIKNCTVQSNIARKMFGDSK